MSVNFFFFSWVNDHKIPSTLYSSWVNKQLFDWHDLFLSIYWLPSRGSYWARKASFAPHSDNIYEFPEDPSSFLFNGRDEKYFQFWKFKKISKKSEFLVLPTSPSSLQSGHSRIKSTLRVQSIIKILIPSINLLRIAWNSTFGQRFICFVPNKTNSTMPTVIHGKMDYEMNLLSSETQTYCRVIRGSPISFNQDLDSNVP